LHEQPLIHETAGLFPVKNEKKTFCTFLMFLQNVLQEIAVKTAIILNSEISSRIKISFGAYKSLKDLKYNLKNDIPEIYCMISR
jgi:hypothetical protein